MPTGPNSQKNTKARQAAQRKYAAKPEQKKNRASRTKARRLMQRLGKDKKGDGKDVMHVNGNPKDSKKSNLKMGSPKKNRSYARTRGAHKKNPRS